MLIAFYVVSALLLLIAIYFTLIHPFVCIIECGLSKQLSGGSKVFWILASLIFGSAAATLYTLFVTRSAGLRRFSLRAFSTGLVCFAVATCIFYTDPAVQELASRYSESGFADADGTLNEAFEDMANSLNEFEADMAAFEAMQDGTETYEFADEDRLADFEQVTQGVEFVSTNLVENEAEDMASIMEEEIDTNLPTESAELADLADDFLASGLTVDPTSEDLTNAITPEGLSSFASENTSENTEETASDLVSDFLSLFTGEQAPVAKPQNQASSVADVPAPTPPAASEPHAPTYVGTDAGSTTSQRPTLANRYDTQESLGQSVPHMTQPVATRPAPINRYRSSNAPAPQFIAPPRVKNRYTNQ